MFSEASSLESSEEANLQDLQLLRVENLLNFRDHRAAGSIAQEIKVE